MEPNKVTLQLPVQTALNTLSASGQSPTPPKLKPGHPETVSVELDQETYDKLHAATSAALINSNIFMEDTD